MYIMVEVDNSASPIYAYSVLIKSILHLCNLYRLYNALVIFPTLTS